MSKSQRDKGRRGEQEVARIYRERYPNCVRTPNSGGLHVKGDLHGVWGLHIEVKRQEKLNIWAALEQAESEAPTQDVPTVHFKRNRSKWYVALPLDDFLRML